MRLSRVLLGVLAGLLAACATPFEKIDMASLPTANDYPDDYGVTLLSEGEVEFKSSGNGPVAVERWRDRSRHFYKEAKPSQNEVYYDRDVSRVTNVALRGISPYEPDHEVVSDRSIYDFDTPVTPGNALYRNRRRILVKDAKIAALPLGSVIEKFIEVEHDATRVSQFGHRFQSGWPVAESTFRVTIPADWKLEWKAFDGGVETAWEPTVSEESGKRVYVWSKTDVPPLRTLWNAEWNRNAPTVVVRLAEWEQSGETKEAPKSFSELSRYEYERAKDKSTVSDEIKSIANEVLAGAPADKKARAALLFEWARDKINYCQYYGSFEEGYVPHDVQLTVEKGYGDCKDQANIYHTLLKADGIASRLGSLWRHNGIPPQMLFPSPAGSGNHMAVLVDLPGGPYFADPTNYHTGFGELSTDEYGTWFFPISEKGDEPVQLSGWSEAESVDRVRITSKVSPDFSEDFEFERTLSGGFATSTRMSLMETLQSNWKQVVKLPISGSIDSVEVTGGEVPRTPGPVTFKGKGTRPEPARVFSTFTVSPNRFGWRVPGATIARFEKKDAPIITSFPFTKDYELRREYPSADLISSIPPPQVVKSEFGEVSLSYTKQGNVLTMKYREVSRVPFVPSARIEAFRAWIKDADRAAVTSVVTHRKDGK